MNNTIEIEEKLKGMKNGTIHCVTTERWLDGIGEFKGQRVLKVSCFCVKVKVKLSPHLLWGRLIDKDLQIIEHNGKHYVRMMTIVNPRAKHKTNYFIKGKDGTLIEIPYEESIKRCGSKAKHHTTESHALVIALSSITDIK